MVLFDISEYSKVLFDISEYSKVLFAGFCQLSSEPLKFQVKFSNIES